MVPVLHGFRVRLESRSLGLPRMIAIMFLAFTAVGVLVAVLHGIEAAFWSAVYLWLVDSPGLRSSTLSTRWPRDAPRA
jgi:hypothetical protein